MTRLLLDLEREIENGQENSKKIKELYQLLSSYNAYSILLLKVKQEYENKKANIKQYYSDSECYKRQIENLFSLFKSDEYLRCRLIEQQKDNEMIFLIDQDTLLRINCWEKIDVDLFRLDYSLSKISDCKAKVYKQSVYRREPYYDASYYEDKEAFGLFNNGKLITPSYELDSEFIAYNGIDIREILKVQTLDDIYEKINESKNEKVKKLILTK